MFRRFMSSFTIEDATKTEPMTAGVMEHHEERRSSHIARARRGTAGAPPNWQQPAQIGTTHDRVLRP